MSRSILIINGPNLNLLGTREPHIYGSTTLSDVEAAAQQQAAQLSVKVATFQSNHEGAIIDRIQEARGNVDAIIINPGGFTHTSVAIRDAYFTDKAVAMICGLGVFGYQAALEFAAKHMKIKEKA
ncbi:hypothetical protein LQW54_009262 [Pestalotiopsis sp. IQ-011]